MVSISFSEPAGGGASSLSSGVVAFRVAVLVLVVLALEIYAAGSPPSVTGGRLATPILTPHRKLLHQRVEEEATTTTTVVVQEKQPERIGEGCSKEDVVVYQGPTAPLPSGIPTYTVQILNVCASGRSVSRVHLSCGWFSSARLINPRLFRRLRYDDCLANDGGALPGGGSVSFQYANTFHYPLAVSSVTCD